MVHIFLVPSPGRYGISTFDISTFEKYRYRQFLCGEPYPDVRFRSHPNTRTWVLGCLVSNRNEVLFWKPLDGKLWFSRNNSAVKMKKLIHRNLGAFRLLLFDLIVNASLTSYQWGSANIQDSDRISQFGQYFVRQERQARQVKYDLCWGNTWHLLVKDNSFDHQQ